LSLAFDGSNDLFVGAGNGTITKITSGGIQSPFASGLSSPIALAFNSAGTLFEADQGSGNIFEFTPSGGQSTFASVNNPNGLAFDSNGNLFVANNVTGAIDEFTSGGESTFAPNPGTPAGLAFAPVPEPSVPGLMAASAAVLFAFRHGRKLMGGKA
jgi:sugar lactone lactonase YvrE